MEETFLLSHDGGNSVPYSRGGPAAETAYGGGDVSLFTSEQIRHGYEKTWESLALFPFLFSDPHAGKVFLSQQIILETPSHTYLQAH